jgi:MFS family permease
MIEFRLFRNLNFLASNISQFLAGMIELGTAYLLPYFLLMMIGLTPIQAGIALIPATVPIMLAGPLAGRMFDRVGGRIPLVTGFLVLAASGIAFALAVSEREYVLLLPGLILQGIGLGMVLTVNDPTGLDSVPPKDQGQAAGVINTSEQLGGAVGIAFLSAVLVNTSIHRTNESLAEKGVHPTAQQASEWKDFILVIEQKGLGHIDISHQPFAIKYALTDVLNAHVAGYELVFYSTAGIALLGALACFVLVRKTDRIERGRIFLRRSRWVTSNADRTPAGDERPPTG